MGSMNGKEQKITITASSGLSDDEIEQMITDAEAHAEEDEKKKKLIELKNNSDSLIYQADKLISENKDKLADDLVEKINSQKETLKTAIESNDIEKIESEMNSFQTVLQEIGQSMYSQAQPGENPTENNETENNESSTKRKSAKPKNTKKAKKDKDDIVDGETKKE